MLKTEKGRVAKASWNATEFRRSRISNQAIESKSDPGNWRKVGEHRKFQIPEEPWFKIWTRDTTDWKSKKGKNLQ